MLPLNSKIGPVNISFKTHIHQYLTDVLTRIKQPMNLLPKLSYYVPLKILNQFILYYSTHIRDRETFQNKAVNILKSPNLSNLFEIK